MFIPNDVLHNITHRSTVIKPIFIYILFSQVLAFSRKNTGTEKKTHNRNYLHINTFSSRCFFAITVIYRLVFCIKKYFCLYSNPRGPLHLFFSDRQRTFLSLVDVWLLLIGHYAQLKPSNWMKFNRKWLHSNFQIKIVVSHQLRGEDDLYS